MQKKSAEKKSTKDLALTALLLAIVAIVALTAATVAWFTISDNTKVNMLKMDVTTGLAMRFDLQAHKMFEEYFQHLSLPLDDTPLNPVTSNDGMSFRLQDGTVVRTAEGYYIDIQLHFMGSEDMWVHLTSTGSEDKDDGTRIWSDSNPNVGPAMRMAFIWDDNQYFVYDPGRDDISGWTDDNKMFFLKAYTDKPVTFRVWLEGNDELCTNALKGKDFQIKLRFEATDEYNNRLK